MKREKEIIKKCKPFLKKKYKVKKIGFFGSLAREEETKKSDVDILVEFSQPIGWEYIDLKDFLESKLGRRVDLVTKAALKPELKNDILKDLIYA